MVRLAGAHDRRVAMTGDLSYEATGRVITGVALKHGPLRRRKSRNGLQRSLENAHQRNEEALVLQTDFDAEADRALAVEDHQFCQTLCKAKAFL
jgi:hypothetical protein